MMWYTIFSTFLVSAQCASFMSRWPLLRGGEGLHILSWDRAFLFLNAIEIGMFKALTFLNVWK